MMIQENVKSAVRKKHYTQEQKNNYCKLWRASGLTQTKFCKANHLAIQTFSRWIKEIKKEPPSELSFIPIQAVAEKSIDNHIASQTVEIKFLNGVRCYFSEIKNTKIMGQFVRELHDAFITH